MAPFLLYTGGYEGTVVTLAFDPTASPPTLTQAACSTEAGKGPSWLTLSPDGATLYALDCVDSVLYSFRTSASGLLSLTSRRESGGVRPLHASYLQTKPPSLVVTNYLTASLCAFPLRSDGTFDPILPPSVVCFLGTSPLGPHTLRQTQQLTHAVEVDPTGQFCIVPDLGTDELRVLTVDSTGRLGVASSIHLAPGDGPRHVTFSPVLDDGTVRLYCIAELTNSVVAFRVNYSSSGDSGPPTFTPLGQPVSILPAEPFDHQESFSDWHAAEIVLSPSLKTLYATNRAEPHAPLDAPDTGRDDLIAQVALAQDGAPIPSPLLVDSGGRAPRHLSLAEHSPSRKADVGKWIAVAFHDSDEVVIFERTERSEALKELARIKGVGRPAVVVWA